MVTSTTYPTYVFGAEVRQAIDRLAINAEPTAVLDVDSTFEQSEDIEVPDLYRLACDLLAVTQ